MQYFAADAAPFEHYTTESTEKQSFFSLECGISYGFHAVGI